MGLVNYGVPRQLVLAAKDLFGIRAFVETGTFRGETAAFAAGHFERVYTVEFVLQRFEQTKQKLATFSNITCLQGNSPEVLKQIAPSLVATPSMFWLDAHWNGDGESREFECPVAGEVKAINESGIDAFILVDDARYFMAPPGLPCNPDAWPSLTELVSLLSHSERYVVMVEDAIIAWPRRARKFLIDYTRSRPTAWAPVPASTGTGGVFYIPRDEVPHFTVSGTGR